MVYGMHQKKARQKHFFFALIFLLVLSILLAISYFVLYGSFFRVRNIEVADIRGTSQDLLLGGLAADIAGGSRFLSLLGPDNILFWRFSPSMLSASALPIVAGASRNVDLRSRNVTLTVSERKSFGTWCSSVAQDCYVFDGSGFVFNKAPKNEGSLIVKVEDQNQREPLIGFFVFPKDEWKNNFFKTLEVLDKNSIHISKVLMRDFSLREWEAVSNLGFSFYFSLDFAPENLDAVLKNLSRKLEFSRLSYLDFRVQNRVYYK